MQRHGGDRNSWPPEAQGRPRPRAEPHDLATHRDTDAHLYRRLRAATRRCPAHRVRGNGLLAGRGVRHPGCRSIHAARPDRGSALYPDGEPEIHLYLQGRQAVLAEEIEERRGMPTYAYRCETCGPFVVVRRVADRDAACACPRCKTIAQRMLTMPALALLPSTARAEHQVNERAVYTHQHGAGCGCGAATQSSAE